MRPCADLKIPPPPGGGGAPAGRDGGGGRRGALRRQYTADLPLRQLRCHLPLAGEDFDPLYPSAHTVSSVCAIA
ncbi:hypothetical protein D9602_03635 [Sphingomonas sp. TX0522]|nr:hypothetical protein [Sphingomonas sp. TX0522]